MIKIQKIFSFVSRFEVSLFIGWFLAIHIFELLILPSLMVPTQILGQYSLSERYLQIWTNSADTRYYLSIAQNGYKDTGFVFFPLWPIMLRFFGANALFAKLISCGLTLSFFILLVKLIKLSGFESYKTEIIFSLIAFPFSFMLLTPMSEPLYLLLIVLVMILAKKKKFLEASLLAGAATATRMVGVVIIVYLFLKMLQSGKQLFRKQWVFLLFSPLGILFYSAYQYVFFGNPLLFYQQEKMWTRSISAGSINKLIQEIVEISRQIVGPYKPVPINLFHFGSLLLFIFLIIFNYKKLDSATWVYCLLSVMIPLASGTFLGVPRYLITAFPLFFSLGSFLKKKKILFYLYLILGFMLQSYLLIRFFNFEMVA